MRAMYCTFCPSRQLFCLFARLLFVPVPPVGPAGPAAPVPPVGPVGPAPPVAPVGPRGPSLPGGPGSPTPVAPVAPVGPEHGQGMLERNHTLCIKTCWSAVQVHQCRRESFACGVFTT